MEISGYHLIGLLNILFFLVECLPNNAVQDPFPFSVLDASYHEPRLTKRWVFEIKYTGLILII
jgi:hypothetical protein